MNELECWWCGLTESFDASYGSISMREIKMIGYSSTFDELGRSVKRLKTRKQTVPLHERCHEAAKDRGE